MIQGVAVNDAEHCLARHAGKHGWEYLSEIASDERWRRTACYVESSLKELARARCSGQISARSH